MQDLKVVVKEIGGVCDTIEEGAYLPLLPAKQRKLDEPGDWMAGTWEVQCPDPNGRVIMQMIPIDPL